MAEGKYVTVGDIQEWQWDKGEEPKKFGGVEPQFDPTSAPAPEPSPAESSHEPEPEVEDKPKRVSKK